MNKFTIVAIVLQFLAILFGAIGTYKSRKSHSNKVVSELKKTENKIGNKLDKIDSGTEESKKVIDSIKTQVDSYLPKIVDKIDVIEKKEYAELEIEFSNSMNPTYSIRNLSNSQIAEDIMLAFAIWDLDKFPLMPLPLKSSSIKYVNPESMNGPVGILGNYFNDNNRYFGIVMIEGRGIRLKTYWIYINTSNSSKSFYSIKNATDQNEIQFGRISMGDFKYLEEIVPLSRRTFIK